MKSTLTRLICRILTASLIVLPWQAQAGMIATDQALDAAQQRTARATVAGFIDREGVAAQFQAFGLSPQAAKARVAALSDAEVAALAGRIDALPAGGSPSILPIIVVLLLFYFLVIAPPATAKESPRAPATKPAPEKK